MTPDEQWRAVVGYEGYYEVSDQGRVRSVSRQITQRNGRSYRLKGRVLKTVPSKSGLYDTVSLVADCVYKTFTVHTLIAAAFLGPRPDGRVVCHNNGDGHDNRLANLRYDTQFANAQDTREHGTHANAIKTHCPSGHPYSADNTYRWFNPKANSTARICRTCRRLRAA